MEPDVQPNPERGLVRGQHPEGREYRQLHRTFLHLVTGLPPIDGWAITATPFDSLDDIAQLRLDAQEVGEVEAHVSTERTITAPGEQIDEYRARMTRGRRQLVRARLEELVGAVDATLDELAASPSPPDERSCLRDSTWERLKGAIAEIDRLLVRDQRSAVDQPAPPPWLCRGSRPTRHP